MESELLIKQLFKTLSEKTIQYKSKQNIVLR